MSPQSGLSAGVAVLILAAVDERAAKAVPNFTIWDLGIKTQRLLQQNCIEFHSQSNGNGAMTPCGAAVHRMQLACAMI
jgi:hypothetical protein